MLYVKYFLITPYIICKLEYNHFETVAQKMYTIAFSNRICTLIEYITRFGISFNFNSGAGGIHMLVICILFQKCYVKQYYD